MNERDGSQPVRGCTLRPSPTKAKSRSQQMELPGVCVMTAASPHRIGPRPPAERRPEASLMAAREVAARATAPS